MKSSHTAQAVVIVLVTSVAIACGGRHDLTHLTALFTIAGLTTLIFPGVRSLGWSGLLLLAAIPCLALTSYLPAAWFQGSSWRPALVNDAGIPLPQTLTAQPWRTAQSVILLLGSLSWLSYLVTFSWPSKQRRQVVQGLMLALSFLALTFLLLESRDQAWPWRAEHAEQFSPFANRNQLATLCAISLTLHVSALIASFQSNRYRRIALLAIGVAIAMGALVTIGSRAGLVLGCLGAISVIAVDAWQRRHSRVLAITVTIAFFGLAALFLSDTRLAERLTSNNASVLNDFETGRIAIYRDTLSLAQELPFFGHGLGNFAQVFPFYRNHSVSEYHLRHPESDWLWWWSEMGWPVIILAICAGLWLLRNRPRVRRDRHERRYDHGLRLGLLAAAGVFVLHSIVDVPAHRLGTLWVGLLILSLLLTGHAKERVTPKRNLVMLPCALVAATLAYFIPPNLTQQTPLAWQGYYQRALSHLESGQLQNALSDFQRARFLEPLSAQVPLAEGNLWLRYDHPSHALAAWREAMNRDPSNADTYYDRFLKQAKDHSAIPMESLLALANGNPMRLRQYQALVVHQAKR